MSSIEPTWHGSGSHTVMRLASNDNVVVTRHPLAAGTVLADPALTVLQDTPAAHKLSLCAIPQGHAVVKGGVVIGHARTPLPAGAWVGPASLVVAPHGQGASAPWSASAAPVPQPLATGSPAHFLGYRRPDGRVGTRNHIGIFVVGNCGATVARRVADHFNPRRLAAYPQVDGVLPFVHEIGCGMEMTGEPMNLLRRTIAGTLRNPNIAGAVVVALGCERNNIRGFFEQEGLQTGPLVHMLVMQELGGTANTIEAGIAAVQSMLPQVNACQREPVPVSHLVVGLQTVAPDGFCAVSANPVVGVAVDLLVQQGGTAILSDSVDLACLADTVATRVAHPEVLSQLRERAAWWAQHTAGRDTQLRRPGQADTAALGLSTLPEKAAAGWARAGSTPVQAVVGYAHPVRAPGVVVMDAPTYEAVSATGQVASGANLLCLTTGGGSAYGASAVPTLKLASHSALFDAMPDDLDLDCGPVLDGQQRVEALGREVFDRWLAHASGQPTCSEVLGVGEDEFVPWPVGVLA